MKVRPWEWTPFTNSARGSNDTFVLYHWQHKSNPDDPLQEYPFAKFNKVKTKKKEKENKMQNTVLFKIIISYKFYFSMLTFQHILMMNMNNIYKIKIGLELKPMFYLIYAKDLN